MLKSLCRLIRYSGLPKSLRGMCSVEEFVNSKLKSKKVVVFSKTHCPYCDKAKAVLAKFNLKNEDYEVIEIEDRPDYDEIQGYMKKVTGASSVPRVFVNGKFIGGGDDTVKLEKSGELKKMLTDAGAI